MSVTACPGCATAPVCGPAGGRGAAQMEVPTHHLVLPGIHCAGCISAVESTLLKQPNVNAARVNLTKRRVSIASEPGLDPTPWIAALSRAGFEAYEAGALEERQGDDLILPLGVAGFAMMNVMLLSVAVWSGAMDSTRDLFHWISAAIALPATAFAAQPFFRHAWSALRVRRLNMDVPISLAIILACGMSVYEVMHGGAHAWFDAALALTFFLLIGRVLDQRLRRRARSAADDLAALEPARVTRIEGADKISRPVAEIAVGDRLWITAGARVPVDAVLEDAETTVDCSFLTGESDPVTRHSGEPLHAGEAVLAGPVALRATAVGEDTTLRRIAQLVATAEVSRGHFRSLADRAAAIYTPAVHIISAGAFLGWLFVTGDVRMALNVAIATLIITCPCALGLAVPAVAVAATSQLYRRGLLLTSDTALERLAGVDMVVFDKTGTLTERRLTVPPALASEARSVLRALSEASDHPLCRGITAGLQDVSPTPLTDIREEMGEGVRATWRNSLVFLGRRTPTDATVVLRIDEDETVLPAVETLVLSAKDAVAGLRALGLKTAMLTGDTAENAERMAQEAGIDRVWSGERAEAKLDIIEGLKAEGERVLMVGDGLNDHAAISAADVSIAPGSALDATRNAADIIIVSGDMTQIPDAIRTCRLACRRMKQNFGIAAGYNSIAVPIAVLGFATPLAAAVAMSTSSITVVVNAIRGFKS
ncbi:MAG: heavy metal translocating P-type ATPase [Pseudomonadota bacterium]